MHEADAVILGAGFYGCHIALALKKIGFRRVQLIEKEFGILRRASFANQARIHNGYHYPRSILTGLSSRRNSERFIEDFSFAVPKANTMIYALAHTSQISGSQFTKFCESIGAPWHEDRRILHELFDSSLVENCFRVRELAFNAVALAEDLSRRLALSGVEVRLNTSGRIISWNSKSVNVAVGSDNVRASYLFNCTYANLENQGVKIQSGIKKELAELALINISKELSNYSVTVMDGPFFSVMPFPAMNCYSLSHVRYTPHIEWEGREAPLSSFRSSRAVGMVHDASRYLPCMKKSSYLGSLYEIKTILKKSEASDSRPILLEKSIECPRIYSILGAKIDNIYDVLDTINQINWEDL